MKKTIIKKKTVKKEGKKSIKKELKKKEYYLGKFGCYNCNDMYDIQVERGINTTEHLIKNQPKCRKCGCTSLKNVEEYKTNKKIMKDVMLHHVIEHMGDGEAPPKKNEYIK